VTKPGTDRERVERILAGLNPKQPDAPNPEPPKKAPWRRIAGGLLDLLAVAAATYTLVVATPVGGLIERGFHWALGHQVHTRPLVSFFRQGGGAGVQLQAVKAMGQVAVTVAPTTLQAQAAGLDPQVARSVALILSQGEQQDGHFDVKLPPAAAASLAAVGLTLPLAGAEAEQREAALIQGLGKLQASLTSPEAAVAALAVQLPRVRYAVKRAKASGAAHPERYVGFRAFLPPDDRAQADPLVHGTFALVTAFGMGWPVPANTRVSSAFGYREHPVLGRRKLHTGIDLAVPTGTEIMAIAAGRVLYTASDGVNGRFVKIDHGHGLTSIYCHNSTIEVGRGQTVTQGQLVAKSGASGRVSGPHLHFQMEIDDEPVDPELFWNPQQALHKQDASEAQPAKAAPKEE